MIRSTSTTTTPGSAPASVRPSRRNALQHGLTARTLLPDVFGSDQIEQAYQQLAVEFQPRTPSERHQVRELARHHLALRRCELIEDAVLRRGAASALELGLHGAAADCDPLEELIDALLTGAGTSDALEKVSRYRRMHERGAERALDTLQQLQQRKLTPQAAAETDSTTTPPIEFATEADCETYLAARWQNGPGECPHCGASEGSVIAERGIWQCGSCRKQVSLRAGTLLAGSRIDLLRWFRLIEAVLRDPQARTEQLAAASGLTRKATVRKLAARIRQACAGPDATQQLAGLNEWFDASVG